MKQNMLRLLETFEKEVKSKENGNETANATAISLRSWRYCVGARVKFWRRNRVPKKWSRDEAVFLAATQATQPCESSVIFLFFSFFVQIQNGRLCERKGQEF